MFPKSDPYPAVLFMLDEGDVGYDKGGRYRLEQLDGGAYGFKTREGVDVFVNRHNFNLINLDEMIRLRRDEGITQES